MFAIPRHGRVVVLTVGVLIAGASPAPGAEGTVTTVAGTKARGYSGDGGPATEARLYQPRMSISDTAGNVYIADTFNQVIRKIDATGTISTAVGVYHPVAAGTSDDQCPPDFDGDGGPAAKARMSCPHSVALDAAGNLYIADSGNNRIRRVDGAGIITTIAGTGKFSSGGDGGPATEAGLQSPKGITFDLAGSLLIADSGNNQIRKIDTNGVITTIAGAGEPGYSGDGGPATAAKLEAPRTIAVGPSGDVYIAEPNVHRIRKVDSKGIISTLAGTSKAGFSGDGGPAKAAQLDMPRGVGVDGEDNVYIADSLNHRIRRVGGDGVIATIAGTGEKGFSGEGAPATEARFFTPRAVDVDRSGDLYVADTYNNRIRRIEKAARPRKG
jgi:sugar lactone lactonase YvrE